MNVFVIILLGLAATIALLMIAALFMRKNHFVRREIIINVPSQKVFDFLKLLKNQDAFNKHATAGADRDKTFTGTDGTIGYIYAWRGDKDAGVGQKEIKNIVEGKKIETEIRFEKPMKAVAIVTMDMESLSDDQTKVGWSNAGTLNYPVNVLIPMMQRAVAKDMEGSLITLKNILESKS